MGTFRPDISPVSGVAVEQMAFYASFDGKQKLISGE